MIKSAEALAIITLFILLGSLFNQAPLLSEENSSPPETIRRTLPAVKTPQPPVIDGDLSDPCWREAPKADYFTDEALGTPPKDQTEAYILYDDKNIYVAFYAHDSEPSAIIGREIRRDAEFRGEDVVTFFIDPFHTHNFNDISLFSVNPLGTQSSRIGGGRASKTEWKGDWQASAKRVQDGWTAEMAIPWAILNYPPAQSTLTFGINFLRQQERTKIRSWWSNVGLRFFLENAGHWQGVQPPKQNFRPTLSLLPYFAPQWRTSGKQSLHSGLDLRYTLTPELVSVSVINPDFATVEGAVEGIDFSRSERFVPEKRPFFLEGGDFFDVGSRFGIGNFFFSRRIPRFDFGTKLYGRIGGKNAIGLLGTVDLGERTDFVASFRRDLTETSNTTLFLVHKEGKGDHNTVLVSSSRFRRGNWAFEPQIAQSLGTQSGGSAGNFGLRLIGKLYSINLRYTYVKPNFRAANGFIPFTGYYGPSLFATYENQWRKGPLRSLEGFLWSNYHWQYKGGLFRKFIGFNLSAQTRSDIEISLGMEGGRFQKEHDLVFNLGLRFNISNRFRSYGIGYSFGKRADKPFTFITPQASFRIFKRLDLGLSSSILHHNGSRQQHILIFNYEIDARRAVGGRIVIEDDGTGGFLSYRSSGFAGVETFFIIGDPNTKKFVPKIITKWVYPI